MTSPTLREVEARNRQSQWLQDNCGVGLPYDDAHDLASALHGAAYTLRQIEGTSRYTVNIGQSGPASTGIRWLLHYVAANELAKLGATPSHEVGRRAGLAIEALERIAARDFSQIDANEIARNALAAIRNLAGDEGIGE